MTATTPHPLLSTLKFILKLLVASVLIYWPMREGKLDFRLLGEFYHHRFGDWLLALLALMGTSCLSSYRWKCLLGLKASCKLSYLQIIKINWIGQFFDPILPGAASGDMIKILYARDMDKNISLSYLLSSVLVDRIFGLTALMMIMGIACCASWKQLTSLSPEVETLMLANMGLFLLFLGFLLFLFSPQKAHTPIKRVLAAIPWLGPSIGKLLEHFWFIGNNKAAIARCLFISILCQSTMVFVFWQLAHPHFPPHFTPLHLLTLYPIGIVTTSIPITPLGLGVGHVLFDRLFAFYGVAGGANYFNSYILTNIVNRLLGVFPYLLEKRPIRAFTVLWRKKARPDPRA